MEGIGYDFIPDVLSRDPADVDSWIKTGDEESFAAVSVLMRSEGLLVGGSSGSAVSGAEKWFKTEVGQKIGQTEGKNVVLILADGSVEPITPMLGRSSRRTQHPQLHEQAVVFEHSDGGGTFQARWSHR